MNFNFCNGSRSPHGNEILFSAQMPDFDHHSCRDRLRQPTWSPDGKKILFARR